jgi:cobalt-zinc-cadmium resistance protein CzcA
MMNSAIFGQLIILIVFIPILFQVSKVKCLNLAMTFSFALVGAMIFCLPMFLLFLRCFKPKEENLIRFLVD